ARPLTRDESRRARQHESDVGTPEYGPQQSCAMNGGYLEPREQVDDLPGSIVPVLGVVRIEKIEEPVTRHGDYQPSAGSQNSLRLCRGSRRYVNVLQHIHAVDQAKTVVRQRQRLCRADQEVGNAPGVWMRDGIGPRACQILGVNIE